MRYPGRAVILVCSLLACGTDPDPDPVADASSGETGETGSAPETELVSPTFASVEVEAAGAQVPIYSIDVIVP